VLRRCLLRKPTYPWFHGPGIYFLICGHLFSSRHDCDFVRRRSRGLRSYQSLAGRLTYIAWKGRDAASDAAGYCR
jgi:hypothetical protein